MKSGTRTALTIAITALVAGGGVAIAYETLLLGASSELETELAFEVANREELVGIVGDYDDSLTACQELAELYEERSRDLLDAYAERVDASEEFFTPGGFWAGDVEELFFRFDDADGIANDAFRRDFDEDDLTDDCYTLAFLN